MLPTSCLRNVALLMTFFRILHKGWVKIRKLVQTFSCHQGGGYLVQGRSCTFSANPGIPSSMTCNENGLRRFHRKFEWSSQISVANDFVFLPLNGKNLLSNFDGLPYVMFCSSKLRARTQRRRDTRYVQCTWD